MRKTVKTYSKPNMANLHGRMGAQILRKLRQQTVKSDANIRKEAEACKKRLMKEAMNGK